MKRIFLFIIFLALINLISASYQYQYQENANTINLWDSELTDGIIGDITWAWLNGSLITDGNYNTFGVTNTTDNYSGLGTSFGFATMNLTYNIPENTNISSSYWMIKSGGCDSYNISLDPCKKINGTYIHLRLTSYNDDADKTVYGFCESKDDYSGDLEVIQDSEDNKNYTWVYSCDNGGSSIPEEVGVSTNFNIYEEGIFWYTEVQEEEEFKNFQYEIIIEDNVGIYNLMRAWGTGLSLFFNFIRIGLAILILDLAIIGIIIIIGYHLIRYFK